MRTTHTTTFFSTIGIFTADIILVVCLLMACMHVKADTTHSPVLGEKAAVKVQAATPVKPEAKQVSEPYILLLVGIGFFGLTQLRRFN